MAPQISDRLDSLYVAAIDRDASLMHANAVSATARWCQPTTTHAQLTDFIQRQIASLEGHLDQLSGDVRASWQWLAGELGPAPVPALTTSRMINFGRRERLVGAAHPGRSRGSIA